MNERLSVFGWSDALQSEWMKLGHDARRSAARVVSVERGAMRVLLGLDERGGLETALATYGGAFAERPISEVVGVGDWVVLDEARRAHAVLPRRTVLVRRAAGSRGAPQIIAANVDRIFVVTTGGRDFNPRRLERYLAAIRESGAEAVIVVNKADLPHDRAAIARALEEVAPDIPRVWTSAIAADAEAMLGPFLEPRRTVAFVGSSGVGKSTIVNRISHDDARATGAVREDDERGRHTTTRRELSITPGRVLLIDTPGMRELGLLDADEGLAGTFPEIQELVAQCRFTDCTHDAAPGCAVEAALDRGELSLERLDSYRRLQRELARERRRADAREARESKQDRKRRTRAMRDRDRLNRRLGLKGDDW